MYSEEELKESITSHMKSIGLLNNKRCVDKGNIVLSVARKLNIIESQEYLIENAFDILVQEDYIRSNFSNYNADGKRIGITYTSQEEKFYLK